MMHQLLRYKAMRAAGIDEIPHDPALSVDPVSTGGCGSRDIDRGEDALVEQVAMREPVLEYTRDSAIRSPMGVYIRRCAPTIDGVPLRASRTRPHSNLSVRLDPE
jgi:hypothetical protein